MRFMKEFSTRIKVGPWEPLEGEWDGAEAGLVEVIERNPVTDDDGNPSPETDTILRCSMALVL